MKTARGMIYSMKEPPATPYAANLQNDILRVRWITGQCVQIKLPDEKILMVDPIFPHSPCWKGHVGEHIPDFTQDMIGKVNYILITHSHADHMDGIPEVLERNPEAVVLCNALFAAQASLVYHIPCGNIRPFLNGQHYRYSSFEMDTFQSTHVDLGLSADPSEFMQIMDPACAYGDAEQWTVLNGYYGTLHGTSFLITLPNGYRIGYATGTHMEELACDGRWQKNKPNFLLRHKVYYSTAGELADELSALGGQLAMPVDFESWAEEDNDVNAFATEVNAMLCSRRASQRLFVPQRYRWYQLQAGIVPLS